MVTTNTFSVQSSLACTDMYKTNKMGILRVVLDVELCWVSIDIHSSFNNLHHGGRALPCTFHGSMENQNFLSCSNPNFPLYLLHLLSCLLEFFFIFFFSNFCCFLGCGPNGVDDLRSVHPAPHSNPSTDAQIPVLRPKSQPQGPNLSFKAQILAWKPKF